MIERRTLEGGMNQDDAPDFIPKGDYLVAHNCRVPKNRDGMGGALKPLPSTVARMTGVVTESAVIGSFTDEPNQRVFFFRWSATNDHRIICWDRRAGTALTVIKQADVVDGLGFGQFGYITGVAMIGDYLYWCDGKNNQPRRIDVERALRANNPSYTSPNGANPVPYTLPLNPWDITVARRVPMYAPKARKLSSAVEAGIDDRATNLTQFSSFQFCHRYIYDTGEISTVGTYSQVVPPNISRYLYPGGINSLVDYDTVRVELDKDETIDSTVERVEVMVREGNAGAWRIVRTFDKRKEPALFADHNAPGLPALGFYFYNDPVGVPVADSETALPFHDVPLLSNALEIADNRLFLFNNTKGYDYITGTDIRLAPRLSVSGTPNEHFITGAYYLIQYPSGPVTEAVVLHIRDSFGALAGWYETPYTAADFNSGSLDPVPLPVFDRYPVIDPDIIPTELISYINPTAPSFTFTPYSPDGFDTAILANWGNFVNEARAFREGHTYKVHVVFFDFAGRNAGICHTPAEIIAPPRKFEQDTWMTGIDWSLSNVPAQIPLWAHSYAIARSRATEPFMAGYTDVVSYGYRQADGSYELVGSTPTPNGTYSEAADAIGIDISKLVRLGFGYSFSQGDLIILIGDDNIRRNLEIIGTQGDYVLAEVQDIGSTAGGRNFYFEIVTPSAEPDNNYWEVGRRYKILRPGSATRAFSEPEGTIYGDTYFGRRLPITGSSARRTVQCMNPNNKVWASWPQDTGRAAPLVYSEQKQYGTDLHPSGPFFPGTETNQLNAFLSGENRQLDLAIGLGQRLALASRTQEYGTVMLAVGESEAASIYLGRTEFFNADETPNVLRSTNVIGNVNILKGGFGTLNPESCFKNDGDVYWFSAIKSAFVRYAKDGLTPISDRKMSSLAAWLGNLVLGSASDIPGQPGIKIVGGFDDYHEEALWAIPAIGTWPIAYSVLDATAEGIAMTEPTPGNITAAIQPGEIHRFSMTFGVPVLVNITVWDYHFGQKTLTTVSANPKLLFVGRPGAPTTITVTTTPALDTILYGSTLERLRANPYSAIDRVPKVIAFSEEKGRWSHTSSHTPEWFGRVGDQLVTFRAGVLYTHDATSVGTFYGVQFPAWVSLAFNEQPNAVKRLQGVSLESSAKPSYIHFRTEEPNVQSSDLLAADIETEEGIFSSSVLRDRLSPNTPGTVNDKLFRGDEMRGRYAKVLFEWTKATTFAARIFNLISRISGGNKT